MIHMYIIKHIINSVAFCMYFFFYWWFTVILITIMLISAADRLKMKIHFRPTCSLLTQFTSCTVLQRIHYDKLIQNRPFYMLDTYSHEDNDIISFLPLFHSFPLSSVRHLYNFDLNMTLNVFRTYNNLYSSFDPLH